MPVPTFEYTSNPHLIAPTTVSWEPVTVGAGAWTNSSWVELLDPTPGTGIAVTGAMVAVRQSSVVNLPQAYEVELGVGAMGAEVPFGVVMGMALGPTDYGPHRTFRPLGVPYELADGLRVAARLRKSAYNAGHEGTWGIGLGYYELPLVGQLSTTTQSQLPLPPASFGISFNPNGVPQWTWGAWTTISSGLGSDVVITGIQYAGSTAVFELEIGYGSTPTVLTRIRNRTSGGTFGRGGPCNVDFFPPIASVPAGEPIKARWRSTLSTIFDLLFYAKLSYLPLPL